MTGSDCRPHCRGFPSATASGCHSTVLATAQVVARAESTRAGAQRAFRLTTMRQTCFEPAFAETHARKMTGSFTPNGAHCQGESPNGAFVLDISSMTVLKEVHCLRMAVRPVSASGESMKIEHILLREIRMRLKAPFETSFGVTQDSRILLVEVVADGLTGWGEITAIESPSYNSETTDTAWHVVSDFIAPGLIGRDIATAAEVARLLQGIRGHNMAKAGVENALWDIEAQQRKLPLWKVLGGPREEIACGVSLGIRETPRALVDKVAEELRSGYQRIKLKIKPEKDL